MRSKSLGPFPREKEVRHLALPKEDHLFASVLFSGVGGLRAHVGSASNDFGVAGGANHRLLVVKDAILSVVRRTLTCRDWDGVASGQIRYQSCST